MAAGGFDITDEELDDLFESQAAGLVSSGNAGALDHLRLMGDVKLADGVLEMSRRNLAAAKFAAQTGSDPTMSTIWLGLAQAEYVGFGGDPALVAADWVRARTPGGSSVIAPLQHCVLGAAGVWTTTWVDPVDWDD